MALTASSRVNRVGATRQHPTTARCPGAKVGPHARVGRTIVSVGYQEASYDTLTDDDAYQASLTSWHVHHVHRRLPLRSVALGDDNTYIIIFKDGDISWSADLPDSLYDTLDEIYDREGGEGFAFASMGRIDGSDTYMQPAGKEVWFCKEADGNTWLGEDSDLTLHNVWWGGTQDHRVEQVFFAPSNGWFALKSGGGTRWDNLPDSLQDALDKNWDKWGGVESLSIGHNGEWFVKYGQGPWQWCGVHPVLAHWLKHKTELTGIQEWVELGPDGSFVAVFENYTLWYGSQDLTDALLP